MCCWKDRLISSQRRLIDQRDTRNVHVSAFSGVWHSASVYSYSELKRRTGVVEGHFGCWRDLNLWSLDFETNWHPPLENHLLESVAAVTSIWDSHSVYHPATFLVYCQSLNLHHFDLRDTFKITYVCINERQQHFQVSNKHCFLLSQVVINPNFEVAESDYTNNIMKCRSRYDGHRMWTYNCRIGETITLLGS